MFYPGCGKIVSANGSTRHRGASTGEHSSTRWSMTAVWMLLSIGCKPATTPQTQTISEFAPTIANAAPAPGRAPEGMVWIPGGEFSMGSADPRSAICGGPDAMPDARPIHRVYVDGFWMDATEGRNGQYEKFVDATAC